MDIRIFIYYKIKLIENKIKIQNKIYKFYDQYSFQIIPILDSFIKEW